MHEMRTQCCHGRFLAYPRAHKADGDMQLASEVHTKDHDGDEESPG